MPIQIKIGVICQIANGRPVCGGPVGQPERPALQAVGYGDLEPPGIALLHVPALTGEGRAIFPPGLHLPDLGKKARRAAVKVVLPVVAVQDIALPIQREPPSGNAVGVTAHHRAHELILSLIILHAVKAQDGINGSPPPLRHQPPQGRAVSQQGTAENPVIQNNLIYSAAIPGRAKRRSLHGPPVSPGRNRPRGRACGGSAYPAAPAAWPPGPASITWRGSP